MTHKDLIPAAAEWLKKKGCSIVITELATTGEEPDAIGWHRARSILIECKASRSDFLADAAKTFRAHQPSGIGNLRYYLAPPGIIKPDELPENWGLLEITGSKIRKIKDATPIDDFNRAHEISILISAIRRIGLNAPTGISIKCYEMESRNRATLGIEQIQDETESAFQPTATELAKTRQPHSPSPLGERAGCEADVRLREPTTPSNS